MSLADVWRRAVGKALSQVDRLTHTRQREKARLRAARRGRPKGVVVVCYGNICRSPYAAAYLRHRLAIGGLDGLAVDSAGLFGPGRPADRQGAAVALERGLDLTGHLSKLIREVDREQADLVLVMTRQQRDVLTRECGIDEDRIELLRDFDADDPPFREIADPYGRSDEEFRKVFGQIERSIDGLCAMWEV